MWLIPIRFLFVNCKAFCIYFKHCPVPTLTFLKHIRNCNLWPEPRKTRPIKEPRKTTYFERFHVWQETRRLHPLAQLCPACVGAELYQHLGLFLQHIFRHRRGFLQKGANQYCITKKSEHRKAVASEPEGGEKATVLGRFSSVSMRSWWVMTQARTSIDPVMAP